VKSLIVFNNILRYGIVHTVSQIKSVPLDSCLTFFLGRAPSALLGSYAGNLISWSQLPSLCTDPEGSGSFWLFQLSPLCVELLYYM
jgi:hypothetical protein